MKKQIYTLIISAACISACMPTPNNAMFPSTQESPKYARGSYGGKLILNPNGSYSPEGLAIINPRTCSSSPQSSLGSLSENNNGLMFQFDEDQEARNQNSESGNQSGYSDAGVSGEIPTNQYYFDNGLILLFNKDQEARNQNSESGNQSGYSDTGTAVAPERVTRPQATALAVRTRQSHHITAALAALTGQCQHTTAQKEQDREKRVNNRYHRINRVSPEREEHSHTPPRELSEFEKLIYND